MQEFSGSTSTAVKAGSGEHYKLFAVADCTPQAPCFKDTGWDIAGLRSSS